MARQSLQILAQPGIRSAINELEAKVVARQPAAPLAVRDDVGYGLTVNGQDDGLAGPYGVNDLAGPVAKFADTDSHVRQRSTWLERRPRRWTEGGTTDQKCTQAFHNKNLRSFVKAPSIALASRHTKVRRDGYTSAVAEAPATP